MIYCTCRSQLLESFYLTIEEESKTVNSILFITLTLFSPKTGTKKTPVNLSPGGRGGGFAWGGH